MVYGIWHTTIVPKPIIFPQKQTKLRIINNLFKMFLSFFQINITTVL